MTVQGKSRRERIFTLWYKTFGPHCAYCDRKMTAISRALNREHGKPLPNADPTIDHVKPKALGGGNQMKNLVVACFECNNQVKNDEPIYPPVEKLSKWFRTVDKYMAEQRQTPQPDPTIGDSNGNSSPRI